MNGKYLKNVPYDYKFKEIGFVQGKSILYVSKGLAFGFVMFVLAYEVLFIKTDQTLKTTEDLNFTETRRWK